MSKFVVLLICLIAFLSSRFVEASCRANLCGFGDVENLSNGDFVCHCYPGYKGKPCYDVLGPNENPCLQNPCWNNGQCVPTINGVSCNCLPPYTGVDCRTIVPPLVFNDTTNTVKCRNDTCINGGVCQVVGNVLLCICGNNYTGRNCETEIPLCERKVNPCQNGGNCTNNACVCTSSYRGEFCEITAPSLLKGIVTVKNTGGYTAVATLTYTFNGVQRTLKKNIDLGRTHTFEYDRPATEVKLTVKALAGKLFLTEDIFFSPTCYETSGLLLSAKYQSVNC